MRSRLGLGKGGDTEQCVGRQGLATVVTVVGRILQDNPAARAGEGMATELAKKVAQLAGLVTVGTDYHLEAFLVAEKQTLPREQEVNLQNRGAGCL
jgi:hypothetical protein